MNNIQLLVFLILNKTNIYLHSILVFIENMVLLDKIIIRFYCKKKGFLLK